MTATVISNAVPFGLLTNQMISNLFTLNTQITRLQAAVGNAATSYSGTAGTEYEGTATNFGVLADSTPGAKGADYSFAVGTIGNAWQTFWTAALGAIEALDNGTPT